jgi:hypothetical protein
MDLRKEKLILEDVGFNDMRPLAWLILSNRHAKFLTRCDASLA